VVLVGLVDPCRAGKVGRGRGAATGEAFGVNCLRGSQDSSAPVADPGSAPVVHVDRVVVADPGVMVVVVVLMQVIVSRG
jgi:hypothetical protein